MMKEYMRLISIRNIFMSSETIPDTWFYLPPDQSKWSLDTEGIFSLSSFDFPPDSDDFLPEQVKNNGWIDTLEGAAIEDVIDNAKYQLENPTVDQLLNAFIFYYENDAFMEF